MRSATLSGCGADDWFRTSMIRFTRAVPFCFEPRRRKHEREESNPVRQFWRLAALPGARSCNGRRPKDRRPYEITYFSSAAFQYDSLTNFDQLSIRTSCAA